MSWPITVTVNGQKLLSAGMTLVTLVSEQADVLYRVSQLGAEDFVLRLIITTGVPVPMIYQTPDSTPLVQDESIRMGIQVDKRKRQSFEICNFQRLNRTEDPSGIFATLIIQPYYQSAEQWVVSHWFYGDVDGGGK